MSHFKLVCSRCGVMIAQCRCPDLNKETRHGVCKACMTESEHGAAKLAEEINRAPVRKIIDPEAFKKLKVPE